MSEASEQCAFIEWADLKGVPVFAIPNGGRRDAKEAAHLKKQGVKPGVPDLFVPVARGGYHGLFIEMKDGRNKPTDKQAEWIALLRDEGYAAFVCYGAGNAMACADWYMGLE